MSTYAMYQLEQHTKMHLTAPFLDFMRFPSAEWKPDILMHFGRDPRARSCIFNIIAQTETEKWSEGSAISQQPCSSGELKVLLNGSTMAVWHL